MYGLLNIFAEAHRLASTELPHHYDILSIAVDH